MDRECKVIRVQQVKQQSIVHTHQLASGQTVLMVDVEVLPHEGFRDGDFVTVTVERNLT